jgi:hypothetical protein
MLDCVTQWDKKKKTFYFSFCGAIFNLTETPKISKQLFISTSLAVGLQLKRQQQQSQERLAV